MKAGLLGSSHLFRNVSGWNQPLAKGFEPILAIFSRFYCVLPIEIIENHGKRWDRYWILWLSLDLLACRGAEDPVQLVGLHEARLRHELHRDPARSTPCELPCLGAIC